MDVLLISAGVVENVICADSVERAMAFYPDHLCMERTAGLVAGPGWLWDGSTFTAPADQEAPQLNVTVTPRQIRQAMNALGLRAQVEAAVAASDQNTKDWWDYAEQFERQHPTVIAMATALGRTSADLDALFTLAGSL